MAFLSASFLIAAQVAPPIVAMTPPAPPPVAAATPPAPPIVRSAVAYRRPGPPVRVSVRVTDGKDVLISDRLWVGQLGAGVTQSRREALGNGCPESRGTLERNVNFQISPWYAETNNRFRATVRWSRPALTGCESGSRSVAIEQTVELAPGQTVALQGDAGLRVELTRE